MSNFREIFFKSLFRQQYKRSKDLHKQTTDEVYEMMCQDMERRMNNELGEKINSVIPIKEVEGTLMETDGTETIGRELFVFSPESLLMFLEEFGQFGEAEKQSVYNEFRNYFKIKQVNNKPR